MQHNASLAQKKGRSVLCVPLERIDPNPCRMRASPDAQDVAALAESIRLHGLLQPVCLRPGPGGRYILVAGERRVRACARLGMQTVEAVIVCAQEGEAALLSLQENLQRSAPHFLDEAAALAGAMRLCALSEKELAQRAALSPAAVADRLRLLRLEGPVREAARRLCLSREQALSLLPLPEGQARRDAAARMAAHPPQAAAPHRSVRMVCDWRLYLNALRDVVRLMEADGLCATMQTERPDGELLVTLRVRRPDG